ncbi:AAA family ATPase [Microbacterium sp. C5A9]|uniref:AAA family ATPase n=1 Tax=Microbacterium sp. C5A9 TaxID=2736663 RepID=UPI001F525CF5|nr:AAA family ATPase [Microbacterium sp. C5A9]MCI1020570.1 AAA family ATPase [Microbacterium sp. C5A9]
MLIAMAGLPGAGKSAVAGEVARALGCALLSVDPIEAAMWRAGVARDQPTGLAAYVVAEDLAREQLLIGNDVVIDAVNDVEAARGQWILLAGELGQPLVFIEVFCSDVDEHRRRLAGRRRGIVGFPEPPWEAVLDRRAGFDSWTDARLRVDSMRPPEENTAAALAYIEGARRDGTASA